MTENQTSDAKRPVEKEKEERRGGGLTSIEPNNQGFRQGVMDSLGEPVKESSTNSFVYSNIARELLKRDLRLARK
jgi:hypothetical protein